MREISWTRGNSSVSLPKFDPMEMKDVFLCCLSGLLHHRRAVWMSQHLCTELIQRLCKAINKIFWCNCSLASTVGVTLLGRDECSRTISLMEIFTFTSAVWIRQTIWFDLIGESIYRGPGFDSAARDKNPRWAFEGSKEWSCNPQVQSPPSTSNLCDRRRRVYLPPNLNVTWLRVCECGCATPGLSFRHRCSI